MPDSTQPDRLTGWTSIGRYIGRDSRTAQRYEQERGLPVRRLPGTRRSMVFATATELDLWLLAVGDLARPQTATDAHVSSTPPSPDAASQARGITGRSQAATLGFMAAAAAAAILMMSVNVLLPRPTSSEASSAGWISKSTSLFDQQGAAAWSTRSPEGLSLALDEYTQAVVHDPSDATAYVGLANSYNLAPEVLGMAPAEAFPRALAAAKRALSLSPGSADAHRALAFVLFWWAQEPQQAAQEFERAVALDPQSALTHHWYATALGARADPRALTEIDRAFALAPSVALLIDKGWILQMLGRDADAEGVLREAERLDPSLVSVHTHLASVRRRAADFAGELNEETRAAELRHDTDEMTVLQAAAAAWASGGKPALMQSMMTRRAALQASGRGSPFLTALAASDLRLRERTLGLLAQTRQARDPRVMSLRVNPDFAWLRRDARFQALAP